MKLLLADDSKLIRDNLRRTLERIEGIESIVESHSVISTIRQIEIERPDAIVLDLQLPDGTGFHLLENLRVRSNPPWVAVLTNFPTEANHKLAISLGAKGLFDKSREVPAMIQLLTEEITHYYQSQKLKGGQQ